MAVYIKNIILYDRAGAVAGYIEIHQVANGTHLRLKHSLTAKGLMLSLVIDGVNKVLKITGNLVEYTLPNQVDLDYEIFACIVQQTDQTMVSLASGAINLNRLKGEQAVVEIDHAMKKICSVDVNGHGECEKCPYREYFFKQAE
ncbi:MAG: hypothetical protein KIG16_01915 [Eubacteriales bacterium]|nr:hypothetical protein [Eubacteriales bacterium]